MLHSPSQVELKMFLEMFPTIFLSGACRSVCLLFGNPALIKLVDDFPIKSCLRDFAMDFPGHQSVHCRLRVAGAEGKLSWHGAPGGVLLRYLE